MAVEIIGGSSVANKPNVENFNLQVNNPGFRSDGSVGGGGDVNAGSITMFSENDSGALSGVRKVRSPETDDDYRLRVAHDNMFDYENFNYTSGQNTSKFRHDFVTMTSAMTVNGFQSNTGSIVTTTTGVAHQTWAEFPFLQSQTLVCENVIAFSAQPVTNTLIDFGLFRKPTANPYAPTDGVYFRLSSAGISAVCNYGGIETVVQCRKDQNTADWTYVNAEYNKYLIQVTNVNTTFWINNELVAIIEAQPSQAAPFASNSLPWAFRHVIAGGAASGILQCLVADYKVYIRGQLNAETFGTISNRAFGSYQGLSGGTVGQLVAGTVTSGTLVKPTAAVPSNTSLTANLPNSLGGRIYEQLSTGLAANVDGIFASYTVPAGSTLVQGKRLRINGIKLSGMVSTVVVGGGAFTEWYIAFGHTSDSMATAESASLTNATTKAPRRIMLPELTTNMGAAQAAGTLLVQPSYSATFQNPIYVNPGERIALVGNKTITSAITSGVLAYTYQFDYCWE